MRTSHQLVHDFFAAVTAGELPESLLTLDMKGWTTTQGSMGRAEYQGVIKILARISARPLVFTIDSITAEEDRAVAEVRSEGTLINGEEYRNTYVFVFRIRDGRIASVAEHFNALIVQEKMVPLVRAKAGAVIHPEARVGQAPFEGRSALIYGAAKGIGRAVALEFARRGARVAIADIDSVGAAEVAALIVASGGRAASFRCDVHSELSVRETAVAAELALGEVDIVMNNVGGIMNGNPEDVPLAEWERIISLNLLSVVRSNAVFLPRMLARGTGHIVNTGSFAGLYPFAASRMPYVAAKAGVIALSESMALYLHPLGIRVSCLCPGPVMTNVMDGMKTWSTNVIMRGPGSGLTVKTVEEVATILADGMRDGRVIIPTHEELWTTLQQHAANPDAFIQNKIDEFARGDDGRPGAKNKKQTV